jgi:hypothetical protein
VKEKWAKTEELLFQQGSVHTELNQKDLWHFALRQTVNGIKGQTLTEELLETTGNLPGVHTLALHGGYSRNKRSKLPSLVRIQASARLNKPQVLTSI